MAPLFKRSSVFGRHWLFFVFVSSLLLFFDYRGSDLTRQVRVFLSIPLEPLRLLVHLPFEWSHHFKENLESHESLADENKHLREKYALLSIQLEKLIVLKHENEQLHALLGTIPQIDGKVTGATVISSSIQSGNQSLLLNKGRSEGVFVGQPVLDDHGLLGQVIRVDWFNSKVLLITDLKSAVPVEIMRTGQRAILSGTGSTDTLKLNNLPKTAKVKKGDILVTSGLGGHFPAGYPVGYVKALQNRSTDMFAQVLVSPVAEIEGDRPVFLLWPNPKPHSSIAPIPL
jgi:rod shape-determining protein MreC